MMERDTQNWSIKDFGDLEEGEWIDSPNGPVQVKKIYEKHTPATMYELEFDNGETIKASGNHLWYIETSLDRALHRKRLKNGLKLFKDLSQESRDELERLAYDNGEVMQTRLIDMMDLMEVDNYISDKGKQVTRVAESLGHIAEEDTIFEDLYSGEAIDGGYVMRFYDAKLFAQQLLALTNKKYRKQWKVILGKVVTTESLLHISLDIDIPEIKQLSN